MQPETNLISILCQIYSYHKFGCIRNQCPLPLSETDNRVVLKHLNRDPSAMSEPDQEKGERRVGSSAIKTIEDSVTELYPLNSYRTPRRNSRRPPLFVTPSDSESSSIEDKPVDPRIITNSSNCEGSKLTILPYHFPSELGSRMNQCLP